MSLSTTIAPYLPYLRRYARALTGSQKAGDSYVRATLETVLAKSDLIPPHAARLGLYALFHVIWAGTSARAFGDVNALSVADERLQTLSTDKRAALLLVSLEGFARNEAAAILNKSEAELDEDLTEAQYAIEQMLACRVLIIEDETIIALDLESMVRELGHDVVGVAATRSQAVELALRERPGLVLADVRLADGSSGMDAVKDILAAFDVPVIFVTAYPERLLTGEGIEPTFLVTKPFLPQTLKATIAQALFFPLGTERSS